LYRPNQCKQQVGNRESGRWQRTKNCEKRLKLKVSLNEADELLQIIVITSTRYMPLANLIPSVVENGDVKDWYETLHADRHCTFNSNRSILTLLARCIIAVSLPGRTNKDCRKRWHNSVAGGLKKGQWSKSEDALLARGVEQHGQRYIN
jgi:hypothetical protein